MADPQPLVCVFFQLPPSDQLFMRIHDIPWLVLLPHIEKLTYALEAALVDDPCSPAMKTLIEARDVMGSKMLPLRDAILESWELSRHYVGFVNQTTHESNLSTYIKELYTSAVQKTIQKIEGARLALFEFQEELESVVGRITSVVGDKLDLSLFITESNQIVSVMIPAIEECSALLQECIEGFESIYKQNFDPESFERNPPSDAEYKLAKEKWDILQTFLEEIAVDWDNLKARMADPDVNRVAGDTIDPDLQDRDTVIPDMQDRAALTGIKEDPPNPEAPPEILQIKKARIPFWRKLWRHIFTCISCRPFC